MQKIAFIDFWNATPHLETAFELAKLHLDRGDHVSYFFAGHDLIVTQDVNYAPGKNGSNKRLPELVGAQLLKSENFKFHRRCNLPISEVPIYFNFETIDELIKCRYKNFSIGSAVLNNFIDLTKQVDIDIKPYYLQIQDLLKDAISCYEFALEILSSGKINLLYVFNGRFINTAAVAAAAKNLNIEVYFHERGSSKDRYFLEKYNTLNLIEMQKATHSAWSESYSLNPSQAKEIASNFFIDNRKGLEKNWISYAKSQKKNLLPKFSVGKRIVTYFSTCDDEYLAIDGWDWDSCDWKDQYSAVMTLIDLCKANNSIELFIRLHPNLIHKSKRQQEKWNNLAKIKGVNIINADSNIDTYGLIDASDLVITSSSMVGIESVYWGTPAVLLGPSYYSSLGAVHVAKTKDALKSYLQNNKLIANRDASLPFGYFWSTFGTPHIYYQPNNFYVGNFLDVNLAGQNIKNLIIVIFKENILTPTWESFKKNVVSELNADLAVLTINSPLDFNKSEYWTNSKFKFEMSTVNAQLGNDKFHQEDVLIKEFLINKIESEGLDDLYDNFIITNSKYNWVGAHPPIEFLKTDESWVHSSKEGIINQHLVLKSEDLGTLLPTRKMPSKTKISLPFPCIMYSNQRTDIGSILNQKLMTEYEIPVTTNMREFYTAKSNYLLINTHKSWHGIMGTLDTKGGFSPSFLLMDRHFNTLDLNLNTNKISRLKSDDPNDKILMELQKNSYLMMRFIDNNAILFDSLDDSMEAIYKIYNFDRTDNKALWQINGDANKAIGLNSSGHFTSHISEIASPPLVVELLTLTPIL